MYLQCIERINSIPDRNILLITNLKEITSCCVNITYMAKHKRKPKPKPKKK